MPPTLQQRLKEKGWSDEEIQKAISIMRSEDKKGKAPYTGQLNPVLYWMSLIVAIIGNLFVALVLIPFFLVLTWQLYVMIAVIALAFGAMFNWLINTLEHVDPAHHVIAGIFIPAFAIITVYVMVNIANDLTTIFKSSIQQNPIAVSVFYVVFFMIPYLFTKLSDVLRSRRAMPA